MNTIKNVLIAVSIAVPSTVGLVAVAIASPGPDHKEVICHPVNGQGEDGYGWNRISVDKASSHFNDDGTPKHRSHDGRVDTYSVDGLCPGEPTPTTPPTDETSEPTGTPTVTETPTETPTDPTTDPTTEPTQTDTPTLPTESTSQPTTPTEPTTQPTESTSVPTTPTEVPPSTPPVKHHHGHHHSHPESVPTKIDAGLASLPNTGA